MKFKLSKKQKQSLAKAWEATKKGYGKTIRFTQEYAPRAERGFGKAASTVVGAFAVKPKEPVYVDLGQPIRRPIKRMKRHDFGSLSFDI